MYNDIDDGNVKKIVREVCTSDQSNVFANHTHTHTSLKACVYSEKLMACIFLYLADLTWEHNIITLKV